MYNNQYFQDGDRQFFFPFLLGGLAGGALVGATRPRPVFVQQPPRPYPPYPYYPPYPNYGRPGFNYSYQGSGYYPY